MASDDLQMGLKGDHLYPFPKEVTDDDYSQRKVFKNEIGFNKIQIDFRLLSAIEFRAQSDKANDHFLDIFKHKNLESYKHKTLKHCFDVNIKYYFHVLDEIKRIHEESSLTINYNKLNVNLMKTLSDKRYLNINDNIISFIDNPKNRKSIVDSFEYNQEFGKYYQILKEMQIIESLDQNQLMAFYISLLREGKTILANFDGKSLTAIAIMIYFKSNWPLIIVCDENRKEYWSQELSKWLTKCPNKLKISVVDDLEDLYVWPKPFHDIMIIDYEFYYQIKDTISFRCLNINAFIFEDQSRGCGPVDDRKPWKGLSKVRAIDNLKNVKRIVFIYYNLNLNNSKHLHRLYPLLEILSSDLFEDDYDLYLRYLEENDHKKRHLTQELQILLSSSYLVYFKPQNDE